MGWPVKDVRQLQGRTFFSPRSRGTGKVRRDAFRFQKLTIAILLFLICAATEAQRFPIVQVGGPTAPRDLYFEFIDSKQRLWLAGRRAGEELILYFDGTRFVSPLSSRVSMGQITGMSEDSTGGIWFAAGNGVYRLSDGVLSKIADGTAFDGITSVAQDVFLTTLSAGESGTVRVVRVSKNAAAWEATGLLSLGFRDRFSLDAAGNVLYACGEAYCEIPAKAVVQWHPGVILPITKRRFESLGISDTDSIVVKDRRGCVWKRGLMGVVYRCPGDRSAIKLPEQVADMGPPEILELHDGSVAIPSVDRLIIGRPGHFRVYTPANGYPSSTRVSVGRDDCLWIAGVHGLFMFPVHLGMEFWNPEEGVNATAWSAIRKGTKVVAMADRMRILSNDRSRWEILNDLTGRLIPGPASSVLLTTPQGIVQTDLTGKTLRRSHAAQVWFLTQSTDGTYWAGGDSLYKVVPHAHELDLQAIGTPGQYLNVQGMQADRFGNIWACGGFGLVSVNTSGVQTFHLAPDSPANPCDSLTVDQKGGIWLGGVSNFLELLEGARTPTPSLRKFLGGGEVGFGGAEFLGSDSRGWLWRGTPNGLYIADPDQARQGRWIHLGTGDGLPALDANQASFWADDDGSVWYGAENSIIHITPPEDMVHPRVAPSLFVSTIAINRANSQMTDSSTRIKNGSDLTVGLGSLQFDRREAMQVEYRMLPDELEWRSVGGFDLHLGKPWWGQHTLQARARLGDGPWSETVSQTMVISAPLWLSWPALVVVCITGFGAAAGGLEWRRRLRVRRAKLSKALPDLGELRLTVLSPELQQLDSTLLDGRFEVGRLLARGGFATVADGCDRAHGNRRCAIKIFRRELGDREWLDRRFHQEVLALEQIHHANVVRIYGSGILPDGVMYLAMEFIEGVTLRDQLNSGRLPIARTAAYLRQIGRALSAVHSRGICHRDLKPENLMLRDGALPGRELVLIDFSIAIVKDPDKTVHGLSRAAGTISYMAPEQAIGYAAPATDIYSLAKVLLEMLTGERLATVLPNASMDLPARVSELVRCLLPGLTPASAELLASALEFDPAQRPHDAVQFAEQIAEELERHDESQARVLQV